jgi:hypothetical protein
MAKRRKNGHKNSFMLKSYNFMDKDPVIDMVRTAVQMSKKSYLKIRADGGPTPSTLYGWFDGKTRRPQFCTSIAAMRAVGGDFLMRLPNGEVKKIR